jgi:hypothetical protein
LVDEAIGNIDAVIETMTYFQEDKAGSHMIFEINPTDDERLEYEVTSASTMMSERLRSWASNQQPARISVVQDRLSSYPFKCQIRLSGRPETPCEDNEGRAQKRKRSTT